MADEKFPLDSRSEPLTRPELLAPAGDRECLRAAVENGADAVYFGLDQGFNARARATNLPLDALPEVMYFLRQRGVRGYVTLNTLVFSDELPAVIEAVRAIAAAGVSAVLVQDLGLARLIRALCPELSIHASTQMTLTSAESICVAESLGIERVVLPRELSIDEIRTIRRQTTMPLEVFVHGALCVAYSGQCLTSESLGGRSANRGQCAQACRLPYELVCDGRDVDLGPVKYLLSPQDLAAYSLLPELLDLGIAAFKIEGRLKSPEYVANITRHYRRAIDDALARRPVTLTSDEVREMELSFSRGFSPGWLLGCDHKMLVPGRSSAKRGVLLGEITAIRGSRISIRLAGPVSRGDGIVFEGDREHDQEQGGRVFEVRVSGRPVERADDGAVVELAFQYGAIDGERLHVGQRAWKTDDPQLTARLRKTFTSRDPLRRTPLELAVSASVGQPLRIRGCAASGAVCHVISSEPLQAARKHPLTEMVLRAQLGRLGGTVYRLNHLEASIDGEPMVPLSILGQLRHEMVRQLDESVAIGSDRHIAPELTWDQLRVRLAPPTTGQPTGQPPDWAEPLPGNSVGTSAAVLTPLCAKGEGEGAVNAAVSPPVLSVLCRSLKQLPALLQSGVSTVYADFADIREYGQAVRLAHNARAGIFLATPRIQKPGESGVFLALAKQGADGILVRNLGGLAFFVERGVPVVADYSLNATNELTFQWLCDLGARRVTASYDLNREQLLNLVAAVPAAWLEVVIHQHMPLFHMEHCVFCAVLSPGTNKTNCGRPCDVHQVRLRDRIGKEHPLHADVGCRNTLFNAVPQSAAEVVPGLVERGVRSFRIELLEEDVAEIGSVIDLYRQLLDGRVTGREVWCRLRATNRVGITRGTLEERRNPLAIV